MVKFIGKSLMPAAFVLMVHGYSAASPGYYLVTAYSDEGEKAIETGLWHAKEPGAPAIASPYVALNYGATSRWYTEVYIHYLRDIEGTTRFNDIAWQNDYLLTQGQYPVDVALHTNIKRYSNSDLGYDFEFGPALQTEFGRTQVNANIFFERSYRSIQAGIMQMNYQWQVKRHWLRAFSFGLQGFGELGNWNDWVPQQKQSHRIGPVVSGSFPVDASHALKYEAAWFTGKLADERAKAFVARFFHTSFEVSPFWYCNPLSQEEKFDTSPIKSDTKFLLEFPYLSVRVVVTADMHPRTNEQMPGHTPQFTDKGAIMSISSISTTNLSITSTQLTGISQVVGNDPDGGGSNDTTRVGGAEGGGRLAQAITQALAQLQTSSDATGTDTSSNPDSASTQNMQQALGAFMHNLFAVLHAQGGAPAQSGNNTDKVSDAENNASGPVQGEGGRHHHHGGAGKLESGLQNLIQQLSSASGQASGDAGNPGAGSSNPALDSLQQSFNNLLAADGAASGSASLGSFLQSLEQRVPSAPSNGNAINTTA